MDTGTQNLTTIYVVYFLASVALTVMLAVVLNRNGRTFLRDVFPDKEELADAINQLLTIGFFMLNLGYAFLILRAEPTRTTEQAVNFLANRLGLLLVSLAALHFVNLAVFAAIRRRALTGPVPPPVLPHTLVPPAGPAPAGAAAGPAPRARFVPGPTLPPPPVDPWAGPAGR